MPYEPPSTPEPERPLFWVGTSLEAVRSMPEEVREVFGFALFQAQEGRKHVSVKPLKGFKGAGVLEVVEEDDGRAYRCVYTVRFSDAVYVLHAFEKKSKKGISTPKQHIERVRDRLKEAEADHASRRSLT